MALERSRTLLADRLHPFGVFGLHGDEALGNDRTQKQGHLGAIAGILAQRTAHFGLPVGSARLIEDDEDFARDRHDDLVDGGSREFG